MDIKSCLLSVLASGSLALNAQLDESFIRVQEGLKHFDQGNYKAAIKSYNEALKLDKKDEMALYEKALALQNLDKEREALKVSKGIIRLKGSYMIDGLLLQADIYESNGKKDKLIEVMKSAVKRYPSSSDLHLRLGQIYRRYNKKSSAERVLKKAYALDKNNLNALAELTHTLIDRKKHLKAILCMYQYLLEDPIAKESSYFYGELHQKLNIVLHNNSVEGEISLINKREALALSDYEDEFEALVHRTNLFFESLQLTRGYDKEFWWTNFIDFYKGVIRSDNSNLLVYQISKSQGIQDNDRWKNFGEKNKQLLSYEQKNNSNSINLAGKE